MKTCPNCQEKYDSECVFCEVCGSQLIDFLPVIEESQPAIVEKIICMNCGNEVLDDAVFCTECGSKLADLQSITEEKESPILEIAHCINCGEILEENAAFCTACGFPVNLEDSTKNFDICTNKAVSRTNAESISRNNVKQAPVAQLKTNRGLFKTIFFTLITFGIYALVDISSISNDINVVASRYDGKKTMHFCLLCFIVAPLTLYIGAFVWYHKISTRIGAELKRRGIDYSFGASDYWLWNVLGFFIIIGPFVYLHKLCKAVNLMNTDYNING